jgi:DNA polymerase III delta subunit
MKTSIILKCLSISLLTLSFVTASYAIDELTPGPGLFSGSDGKFLLLDTSGKKKKKEKEKAISEQAHQTCTPTNTPKYVIAPQIDTLTEFDLFKEWRSFKKVNDEVYEEFIHWVEYRKYLEESALIK